MGRKRYLSTEISTDSKLVELSAHGYLPLVIYTWSIPHMDDWGRITGDARQFKLIVCPGLDVSVQEVDTAIDLIVSAGLWVRYEVDGKQCLSIAKSESWFKHQSYINKSKRTDDAGSNFPNPDQYHKTPQNAEEHQGTPKNTKERRDSPQNTVSFSSSFPVSSSPSKDTTATTANPFKIFESEGFGTISSVIGEKIGYMIDDYGERWVIEAMKEASYYGKRNLPYVKSILERYKASGIDDPWTAEKIKPFPKGGQQNAKHGTGHDGRTDAELNAMSY